LRHHIRNSIDGKHTNSIKTLTHWSSSLITDIHTGFYRTAEEYTGPNEISFQPYDVYRSNKSHGKKRSYGQALLTYTGITQEHHT